MSDNRGYVYILTNPSFREDWVKIGKSSRPVDIRSKELDNTSVPLPFRIYATLQTKKYEVIEKQIHKILEKLAGKRIRKEREFFNILPEEALNYLSDYADLIDDAEILGPEYYKRVKDGNIVIEKPIITLKKENPTKNKLPSNNFWNNKPILGRAGNLEIDEKKIANVIFHHKRNSVKGELFYKSGLFILSSGSYVNPEITSNIDTIKSMRETFKKYITNHITTEDLPFNSPSGASQFICGTASQGTTDWIDDLGKPICDYAK